MCVVISFVFEVIPNDLQISDTVDTASIVIDYEPMAGDYFVVTYSEGNVKVYTAYRKDFMLIFPGKYHANLNASFNIANGTAEYLHGKRSELQNEFANRALDYCCVYFRNYRGGDDVYIGISPEEPTVEAVGPGVENLQYEQVEDMYVFIYSVPYHAQE